MAAAQSVDEYIAGFPPEVAERLQRIREVIVAEVAAAAGTRPTEKIRYGIAAVMLGGRYALHYAGWKKHIGLYPVPRLAALEAELAPYRSQKDTLVLPHAKPIPYALIGRVTAAIVAEREAAEPPA